MHVLSVQGEYVMQVELSNWKDETESVKYLFSLGGEEGDYTLHLKDVSSGSLASALASNPSGLPFSTRDRDNDQRADINCAKHLSGMFRELDLQLRLPFHHLVDLARWSPD